MGLECPMCGLSEEYVVDDPVTSGKKYCKGCGCKFMPTGSMYKREDPFVGNADFKKGGKKDDDKPNLHRG